jgi:hypothetical protein
MRTRTRLNPIFSRCLFNCGSLIPPLQNKLRHEFELEKPELNFGLYLADAGAPHEGRVDCLLLVRFRFRNRECTFLPWEQDPAKPQICSDVLSLQSSRIGKQKKLSRIPQKTLQTLDCCSSPSDAPLNITLKVDPF